MRVTPQMVSQRFIKNMNKSNEAIANLQGQISSGRKFEKISDNPSVALQGLSHRSSLMQIEQYQKNVQDGIDWLTATDDALGGATEVLQRVRELIIQASNDTNSNTERTFASEIRGLKDQLGNITNSNFNGRYIFSGIDSNVPPYQDGEIRSNGQSSIQWNIGHGQTVNPETSADKIFGMEVEGKTLFGTLDSIIQKLENGETPNSLLSNFDRQLDNVIIQRVTVGANQNVLQLAANKLNQANFMTQKMWSEIEGTDVAKAYVELSAHESTLKASLTAGSKIMQITLADFLS